MMVGQYCEEDKQISRGSGVHRIIRMIYYENIILVAKYNNMKEEGKSILTFYAMHLIGRIHVFNA